MQLSHQKLGKYMLIKAAGRLDATWSDYFAENLLAHIRNGNHDLIIDSEDLLFLSSAGIRSLVIISKELNSVEGSFQIVNASSFISKTLETTGFKFWLSDNPIPGLDQPAEKPHHDDASGEVYILNQNASLQLSVPASWHPWKHVDQGSVFHIKFPGNSYALGIGGAAESDEKARQHFGEFLSVAGNVIFQAPEEGIHPDFLFSEKDYIPEMHVIQALFCTGEMSHLFRFEPSDETLFFTMNQLVRKALSLTGSKAAGFIILGEVEGLVGTTLIRSPGLLTEERVISYPEICEWISFTGERVFAGQQALMFGIAKESGEQDQHQLLNSSDAENKLKMHVHAAVFPYQPLQNGELSMLASLQKFFNGPPPKALLHLVNDFRPAAGLGQSALIRGACWCSAIINPEVIS